MVRVPTSCKGGIRGRFAMYWGIYVMRVEKSSGPGRFGAMRRNANDERTWRRYLWRMTPESVIDAIRAELRRRGSNPYRLARETGLPENSIRYLLDGHEPKLGRLIEVCDALGLQFYVGPPGRLGQGAPPYDWPAAAARRLELLETSAHALNRLVVEEGGDPFPADLRETLGVTGEWESASPGRGVEGFRKVIVVEFAPAAGDGATAQMEEPAGFMWFPSELLARLGVDPAQCAVIGVRGESMEPTLPDGCSILVDRAHRGRRSGGVYVLRTTDEIVVKRCVKKPEDDWWLVSDHPDWADLRWPGDAEILGRVRWMSATVKLGGTGA